MPKQQTGARLKIIVRRLPPHLPEDVFWQSVEQWVTDQTVSWKRFCPGKLRVRYAMPTVLLLRLNSGVAIA
jgi:regulator of nonsense transcripts 3